MKQKKNKEYLYRDEEEKERERISSIENLLKQHDTRNQPD